MEAVLPVWLERQSDVHGTYRVKVVVCGLARLLSTRSALLGTIMVGGPGRGGGRGRARVRVREVGAGAGGRCVHGRQCRGSPIAPPLRLGWAGLGCKCAPHAFAVEAV